MPAELERALAEAGAPRVHSAAYLNEFAVTVPDAPGCTPRSSIAALAGLPLVRWYPDDARLANALWSVRPRSPPATRSSFADALRLEIGAGAAMVEAGR